MPVVEKDFSNRSSRPDWRPPHLFSRVERFEFTGRSEELKLRTLPTGPRGFQVAEFVSSGHLSLTTEFRKTALVFPLAGTFWAEIEGKKSSSVPGDVAAFGPIRRKTTVVPNEMGVYRSLSIMSQGGPSDQAIADGNWHQRADCTKVKSVIGFIEYLYQDLSSGNSPLTSARIFSSAEALLSEYYDELIRSIIDDNKNGSATIDERKVALAKEYMRAHYCEPITIKDVAFACGVSVRSLQSAFRASSGMSPRQVLTAIRMEQARFALEHADEHTTVTSAAYDAGFWHLGRFSRSYASMYGEMPSETLRRIASEGRLSR